MDSRLYVKHWQEFQHYKKRNPPWIKLHKRLLDDFVFQGLPLASRALAPMLWLLASESSDGSITSDLDDLAFRLRTTPVDISTAINPLILTGFLLDASKALALCKQGATLETEAESKTDSVSNETVVPTNGHDPTPDLPPLPKILRRTNGGETRVPVQKAFDNYNLAAAEYGLPLAEKLTEDRRRKLRARLKEHTLEGWNRALTNIEGTPFLRGENDRGWRADLDFLLQPTSLNKVLEGAYGDDDSG